MERIKMEVCKVLVVLELVFCAMLFAAAVEGGLPVFTALVYGVLSLCGVDWVCRVLLPSPAPARAVKVAAPRVTLRTGSVLRPAPDGRAA